MAKNMIKLGKGEMLGTMDWAGTSAVDLVNHPSLKEGACFVRSKGNWLTRRH